MTSGLFCLRVGEARSGGHGVAAGGADFGGRANLRGGHGGRLGATDEMTELADVVLQHGGLAVELFGGGGGFLGAAGVGLGDFVHLAHRGVDLTDALSLLLGGDRDFGDDFIYLAGFFHDDAE